VKGHFPEQSPFSSEEGPVALHHGALYLAELQWNIDKARIFLTSVKIKVFNKTIRKYQGGEGVMACSKKCGTTKKTTKKPASKKK
jgi:hypothetical protein